MGTSHKGGMLVGYARVSTGDQSLDLQEDALRKAGCGKLFTDVASGAKDERAGLAEALAFLRPGETLVVWKLDRMGRSLKHLIETVTALEAGIVWGMGTYVREEARFYSSRDGAGRQTAGETPSAARRCRM